MTGIGQLLRSDGPPFALLYRPESAGPAAVEVLTGEVHGVDIIAELPIRAHRAGLDAPRHDVLAVLPYRQVAERGFSVPDDGAPLLAMTVREQWSVPLEQALEQLPDTPIEVASAGFDISDAAYAVLVRQVIDNEIGCGEGSNFVIKRSFTTTIRDYSPAVATALFRRLLLNEFGSYWTFVVHTGGLTFVGVTPERHVTLMNGVAIMNPISGTYRYPETGPDTAQMLKFVSNGKESDELYMVLDEELKMMASVCDRGGRAFGPFLKEMAHLAHTEYFIKGRTSLDVREVLRRTLLAPTIIGSPLESACRVVTRYEPEGRGYYGGVLALIGRDTTGRSVLDSAILIRTAQVDQAGELRLDVGATVVRHSDPAAEAAETRAKASGLTRALVDHTPRSRPSVWPTGGRGLGADPRVMAALARRNDTLAGFWLNDGESVPSHLRLPDGHRVLVVDAEDTFTSMLAHQIRALGSEVTVRRFDEPFEPDGVDLVVIGPGPGDPRQVDHPKIAVLRDRLRWLLDGGRPVLAICLGHQVLSGLLGFQLVRRAVPNQGAQREIELFGTPVRVGFYSTFAAHSEYDEVWHTDLAAAVEVCRDPSSGEVHALRGPGFQSFQFHPESVLSADGLAILSTALSALLPIRVGR
jgi:phenazine biosynthesis protein phzE